MIRSGQRVAFRTSPDGFQAAWVAPGVYYHLNCQAAIACTAMGNESEGRVVVRPEDWPESAVAVGFSVPVESLTSLAQQPAVALRGRLTDGCGHPFPRKR